MLEYLRSIHAKVSTMLGFWFHAWELEGGPNQIDTKGTIFGAISSIEAYFIDERVVQNVCKDIIEQT